MKPQIVPGNGEQQQFSDSDDPGGERRMGHRKPLLILTLVLVLAALAAALPWRSTLPAVITAPAQIAVTTALPSNFSMEWLASELMLALSAANAGALPPHEVLQLSLRCDHRACTLALHPAMNTDGRGYEQQFVASRDPEVWETAISELARVVATH